MVSFVIGFFFPTKPFDIGYFGNEISDDVDH